MKDMKSPFETDYSNFLKLGLSFFLYTAGAAILLGAVGYFIGIVDVSITNEEDVSSGTVAMVVGTLFLVFASFVAICLSIAYWLFSFSRKYKSH